MNGKSHCFSFLFSPKKGVSTEIYCSLLWWLWGRTTLISVSSEHGYFSFFSYFSRTGNVSPLLLSKYVIMTLDGFNDALTFCVTPSGVFFFFFFFHISCTKFCVNSHFGCNTRASFVLCTKYKIKVFEYIHITQF